MQCWLRSYREAKLTQQDITRKYAEASKKFFQPRHKPKLTLPPTEGETAVQTQPKPAPMFRPTANLTLDISLVSVPLYVESVLTPLHVRLASDDNRKYYYFDHCCCFTNQ